MDPDRRAQKLDKNLCGIGGGGFICRETHGRGGVGRSFWWQNCRFVRDVSWHPLVLAHFVWDVSWRPMGLVDFVRDVSWHPVVLAHL